MAKVLLQSIITWFTGSLIGFLTIILIKIEWPDKDRFIIAGIAGLFSLIVFYVRYSNIIDKSKITDMEKQINEKADKKDIENIEKQFVSIHQILKIIVDSQTEQHATIDNIYNQMINQYKK